MTHVFFCLFVIYIYTYLDVMFKLLRFYGVRYDNMHNIIDVNSLVFTRIFFTWVVPRIPEKDKKRKVYESRCLLL